MTSLRSVEPNPKAGPYMRRRPFLLAATTVALCLGMSGCSAGTAPVQAAPTVVQAGKGMPAALHRWQFDDGSGLSATDTAKKQPTPMQLQSGAAWTAGIKGTALSLNGNGQEADSTVKDFRTTGAYSVAAWVRLSRIGDSYQTVVSEDPVSAGSSSAFFLQYAAPEHTFAFSFSDARAVASAVVPRAGAWYQLVGVRNASDQTLALYVNGKLAGTAGAPTDTDTGGGTIVIGRGFSGGGAGDYVGGAVDDVALYATALTARQVAAIYNESAPR